MLNVHPEWREDLEAALEALNGDYRDFLQNGSYIPKREDIFNAFKTLPKSRVRYILFGQDPYPRPESATGYAFIDGAVENIFSSKGLDKRVNRATSLRNFVKMALVASGRLKGDDLSQEAIAGVEKSDLIDSIFELRVNFERNGVLLLNTALVFENKNASNRHAKEWSPFVKRVLSGVEKDVKLILFGSIAKSVAKIPEASPFEKIVLEHPYNHTFVLNQKAHELFGPMKLLEKE